MANICYHIHNANAKFIFKIFVTFMIPNVRAMNLYSSSMIGRKTHLHVKYFLTSSLTMSLLSLLAYWHVSS